jgi:hypothetical protein
MSPVSRNPVWRYVNSAKSTPPKSQLPGQKKNLKDLKVPQGTKHPNRATHYLLYTSLCTGELNAIRKHKCYLCSPFYVKGVSSVFAYAGLTQNLKELISALYCWILEILYYNPKGRRALLRIPSTEGRSVCLCWAKSKPKGPQGKIIDLNMALVRAIFSQKAQSSNSYCRMANCAFGWQNVPF